MYLFQISWIFWTAMLIAALEPLLAKSQRWEWMYTVQIDVLASDTNISWHLLYIDCGQFSRKKFLVYGPFLQNPNYNSSLLYKLEYYRYETKYKSTEAQQYF